MNVAILGAGPIGLEAALAVAQRGWSFTVYEAAPTPAGHVRDWGHVRLFTPWSMNVSPRARAVLGDAAPDGDALPTGDELASRVLDPLAERVGVRLGTRVRAIGRQGLLKHEAIGAVPERASSKFRLLVADADGEERVEHADVVLDCTGTYGTPNALGDGGIPAPGEQRHAARISRRIPDVLAEPEAWTGKTILLTGAGHSAQTAACELASFGSEPDGTRVVWAVRSPAPTWSAVEDDTLAERAALTRTSRELAAGASGAIEVRPGRVTEALREEGGRLTVTLRNGAAEEVVVDRVLALNGGVGDFTLYRQLQVHECYATAAPMKLSAALLGAAAGDCLDVPPLGPETLVNPEPGFFVLGAKSYGRTSQFLMRNGWAQVDDVMGLLA